jgi:hypothetical protein
MCRKILVRIAKLIEVRTSPLSLGGLFLVRLRIEKGPEDGAHLALDEPTLSPRELATRFTDAERYFVSESSAYRMLKAHDLITSPAFTVMKMSSRTRRPPQTSSGRPTSPISSSSAGGDTISHPR